ncbi:hypothetical protein [Virgibacillus kimchii]
MALGSIEIKTAALESKLKKVHEHLGNLIKDLEAVCSNCGSSNTKEITINSNDSIINKTKECEDCGAGEIIEFRKG